MLQKSNKARFDGLIFKSLIPELGLAHGFEKPTVLLNRAGTLGDAAVAPFDLTMSCELPLAMPRSPGATSVWRMIWTH